MPDEEKSSTEDHRPVCGESIRCDFSGSFAELRLTCNRRLGHRGPHHMRREDPFVDVQWESQPFTAASSAGALG